VLGIGPSRHAVFVGLSTTVLGGALALAPERFGPTVGLIEPAAARVIGLADLALVPGLVVGPRQGTWLTARAVLNLAIIGHLSRLNGSARLQRAVAAGLAAASVADLQSAVALRVAHPTDTTEERQA
jgi:hypothetical protein